ncbi:adenylosuccinate synthase [Halalkalicoccus sp. NIPERK01]|uniref:adenylosuccinate synthase n=1 Tax=Halalkalicoccus sp. NIPERK01 TaxID=3053469 RepID=UPI00256ED4BC|nr:adenylosuccinate synthase [Halalkalicoccus sp. NIPERK01]MDL5361136.1 adenylosuccinate synthase [Halalkalicoccus sp. NIPERK01]
MTVTIVGAQLGDEGKGGVVDIYGEDVDVVARYQGGDNAGHTVVFGEDEYKLSLVPSGAIRGKVGVLGNGCVVNPETLFSEIDALRERGLDPRVKVAERAHVILPYHRVLDGIEEKAKEDSELDAGTTGRGIGPTYEDKIGRRGIRIGDLLDPDSLRSKLEYVVPQKRALAEDVFGVSASGGSSGGSSDGVSTDEAFDISSLYEQYRRYGERLAEEEMTVNAGAYLTERIEADENVMFEGAQGTSIDIDHGIFPYVTSSNPTAGYAATGTGVGPTTVGRGEVVGIVKAYLSRVGTGPLPTELVDDDEEELADEIREKGGEFGTVTGRPRRIGWLDMPMLRHAAQVNGFTGLAINHIDVLAGLGDLQVGHAYELDGEEIETMPTTTERWGECEPVLRGFDGWSEPDWADVASEGYDAIPENARTYLEYISDELDTPIYAVGVGPGREQTVVVESPF